MHDWDGMTRVLCYEHSLAGALTALGNPLLLLDGKSDLYINTHHQGGVLWLRSRGGVCNSLVMLLHGKSYLHMPKHLENKCVMHM